MTTNDITSIDWIQKATEFMNQKDRKTYYLCGGYLLPWEDDPNEISMYIQRTPEEAARIKKACIDACNAEGWGEPTVESLEDIKDARVLLYDLEGHDEELDNLIKDCRENEMDLTEADLDTPHYLYSFSCMAYDPSLMEMGDRIPFRVSLTDEEYLYMLSEQLDHRRHFNINSLVFNKPELAKKLYQKAAFVIGEYCCDTTRPLIIMFDEIIADAEQIDAPYPEHNVLFEDLDSKPWFHVLAYTEKRELTILKEQMVSESDTCDKIQIVSSADDIQQRLDAATHGIMLKKLKERFNARTAYEDIKAWFDKEGITYEESIPD